MRYVSALLLSILVLTQSPSAALSNASAAQSNALVAQSNGGGGDSSNVAALAASDARLQSAATLNSSLTAAQRDAIKAILDRNAASLQRFAPTAPSSSGQAAASLPKPSAEQVQGLSALHTQMANEIAGVLTSQQQALFRAAIAPPAKGLQPSGDPALLPAQSQTSTSTSASTEGLATSASSTTVDAGVTPITGCYDAAYYESYANYYEYYGYLYAYYSYYYGSGGSAAYNAMVYAEYALYYGKLAQAAMGGAYVDFSILGSDFSKLGYNGQTDLYYAMYYAYYAYQAASNISSTYYGYYADLYLYYGYIYYSAGYSDGVYCQ
jgi:hypothetical protein